MGQPGCHDPSYQNHMYLLYIPTLPPISLVAISSNPLFEGLGTRLTSNCLEGATFGQSRTSFGYVPVVLQHVWLVSRFCVLVISSLARNQFPRWLLYTQASKLAVRCTATLGSFRCGMDGQCRSQSELHVAFAALLRHTLRLRAIYW